MKNHRNHWKSTKINANPWKSLQINENIWKSQKIKANHRKLIEIHVNIMKKHENDVGGRGEACKFAVCRAFTLFVYLVCMFLQCDRHCVSTKKLQFGVVFFSFGRVDTSTHQIVKKMYFFRLGYMHRLYFFRLGDLQNSKITTPGVVICSFGKSQHTGKLQFICVNSPGLGPRRVRSRTFEF